MTIEYFKTDRGFIVELDSSDPAAKGLEKSTKAAFDEQNSLWEKNRDARRAEEREKWGNAQIERRSRLKELTGFDDEVLDLLGVREG